MKLVYKSMGVCLLGVGLSACATGPDATKTEQVAHIAPAPQAKSKDELMKEAARSLLGASLANAVSKNLEEPDLVYYSKASQNALETAKTGETATWKNPDTGSYGTITSLRTYKIGARNCREYTQTVNIAGRTEEGYGKACRQPDGNWTFAL